jgi:phosphatidate cytidylyltransferase
MAMNWQVFRTRALTALVFVIVMLFGLLWNRWSFFLLFSVVHFGAWHEYGKLAAKIEPDTEKISPLNRWLMPLLGWSLMLYFASPHYVLFDFHLSSLAAWVALPVLIALPVSELLLTKQTSWKVYKWPLGGLLYISLPLALLLSTRGIGLCGSDNTSDWGRYWPCVIIFSIWINDTMAYITGSFIGKTPFSKISPKKTWEGTLGGIVLCVLTLHFISPYIFDHQAHTSRYVFAISAVSAITGTLGDLFESWLKRRAGVKDSGSLMPGHGGFLDRFDSLLFAAPCSWLLLQLLFYKSNCG